MRSCRKLLKSNGHGPDVPGSERQNAPAGGFCEGAKQRKRPRGATFSKSNADAADAQVFLNEGLTSVYDGTRRIGALVEASPRHVHAFDATGERIGDYPTRRAAVAAVSDADHQRRH